MFPDNSSRAADMICVVFIFVYAFGYSLGFGPAAWLYGSEVSSLLWKILPFPFHPYFLF